MEAAAAAAKKEQEEWEAAAAARGGGGRTQPGERQNVGAPEWAVICRKKKAMTAAGKPAGNDWVSCFTGFLF
jgi:hypothetical protein